MMIDLKKIGVNYLFKLKLFWGFWSFLFDLLFEAPYSALNRYMSLISMCSLGSRQEEELCVPVCKFINISAICFFKFAVMQFRALSVPHQTINDSIIGTCVHQNDDTHVNWTVPFYEASGLIGCNLFTVLSFWAKTLSRPKRCCLVSLLNEQLCRRHLNPYLCIHRPL